MNESVWNNNLVLSFLAALSSSSQLSLGYVKESKLYLFTLGLQTIVNELPFFKFAFMTVEGSPTLLSCY